MRAATSGRTFPLPVRAIGVDLDGTMLDTIGDLAAAVNHLLADLRQPPLELALVRTLVGKGIADLMVKTLRASFGRDPSQAELREATAIYERHYERVSGTTTTIYPGVREGLDALSQAGYPLACITNKLARFTGPLLDRMGFACYFSLVVAGDSLPRKKPDPLPLLHTAQTFAVQPAELLMIGDSINDVQAARSAGCPVFCVTYGYNEGHDVRSLNVDAIVPSLVDAAALIQRIES